MNFNKILSLFLLGIIFFLGFKVFDLRLYKLALNQARLIPESKVKILGDNQPLQQSYVYKYTDGSSDKVILYLENPEALEGRNILIINEHTNQIGKPNSNIRNYSKWGKYIFQNDSGEKFISFKYDAKRNYFDPKLVINNGKLSFRLPKNEGYKFERISINF